MSGRGLVLVVGIVLAVVAVTWWGPGGRGSDPELGASRNRAGSSGEVARRRSTPGPEAVAAGAPDTPDAPSRAEAALSPAPPLTGRVLESASGVGLPDLRLRLFAEVIREDSPALIERTVRGPVAPAVDTRTAGGGTFTVPRPPPGDYHAAIDDPGGTYIVWRLLGIGGDEKLAELSIERDPIDRPGIVVDPEGRGIPDATVFASPTGSWFSGHVATWLTRTDSEGRFEYPRFAGAEGFFNFHATAPGFPATTVWEEEVEAGTTMRIVLGEGWSLRGRVLGRDGGPQPEASVHALFTSRPPHRGIGVDADGFWQIRDIAEQDRLRVAATAPGSWFVTPDGTPAPFGVGVERAVGLGESQVMDLHLAPGRRVGGRVVIGKTGQGLAGAEILAVTRYSMGSQRVPPQMTTTDSVGDFSLEGVPPGGVLLFAFARGHVMSEAWIRRNRDAFAHAPPESVVITMDGARDVHGLITDERGRPLPGARFSWHAHETHVELPDGLGWNLGHVRPDVAVSDRQGRFVVRDVPLTAPLSLGATHPRFSGFWNQDTFSEMGTSRDPLRVKLPVGTDITGVLEMPDGSPVRHAGLTLRFEPATRHQECWGWAELDMEYEGPITRTDARGRFRFESVPSGEVEVALEDPHGDGLFLDRGSARFTVEAGETRHVALRLRKP